MFRSIVIVLTLALAVVSADENTAGTRRLRRQGVLQIDTKERVADMLDSLWEVDGRESLGNNNNNNARRTAFLLDFDSATQRELQMSMSMSM